MIKVHIKFFKKYQLIEFIKFSGSRYDDTGNLANWWDNATRTNFDNRAECIIDQYGGYTEPQTNLKLNGVNTQGENIADNGK